MDFKECIQAATPLQQTCRCLEVWYVEQLGCKVNRKGSRREKCNFLRLGIRPETGSFADQSPKSELEHSNGSLQEPKVLAWIRLVFLWAKLRFVRFDDKLST